MWGLGLSKVFRASHGCGGAGLLATLALVFSVGCVTGGKIALERILANYSHPRHGWHRADGTELKNPVPVDARSLEKGGVLFARLCVPCHGPRGRGDGPRGKGLKPAPADLSNVVTRHSDYYLYLQISLGRDGMPMWKSELSERDRWDIVNFVRNLGVHQNAHGENSGT